jgi:hypothetical protein
LIYSGQLQFFYLYGQTTISMVYQESNGLLDAYGRRIENVKVAGDKDISETKSKQQSPCSNCMHRPVMSWGNASCTCIHKPVRCMHRPVMSQADTCTYCMGSKVSSLSRIYLYSSYFGNVCLCLKLLDILKSKKKPFL